MTNQPQTAPRQSGPARLVAQVVRHVGYFPDNSYILCSIDRDTNRMTCMISTELPADPADWPSTVAQALQHLQQVCAAHGIPTEGVVAFVCPDPSTPGYGADSRQAHRPLTELLGEVCQQRGVSLLESLYVTRTTRWSSFCTEPGCCPPEGSPIDLGAPYSHRADVLADLAPVTGTDATRFSDAIDRAHVALHRKIRTEGNQAVVDDGRDLLAETVRTLTGPDAPTDIDDDLVAQLLLLLQYEDIGSQAMHFVRTEELDAARSLWRTLVRVPVDPFDDYRATPLALYGVAAWAQGDPGIARIAFDTAGSIEPDNALGRMLRTLIKTEPDFEPVRVALLAHREGCPSVV
ncbi:DUF4192 domain-containing protein [Kitasatospora purpeofusca]|uniref:DUF4192 domain-containing protein n=1 Tax=Kitasatospora purpeofusca TaxID=67352 RepID=UPI0035DE74B1